MKVRLFLVAFLLVVMSSCSLEKRLAYDFVKKSEGARVAFYVPENVEKENIRRDCQPSNLEHIAPDAVADTIEARTKVVNKIDDGMFLDILIMSYENTLEDYNISLEYWENENTAPDSLHWVVDLSQIEILEYIEYVPALCYPDGYYEILPSVGVNIAAWFDLLNGEESGLLYTEQSYYEQVCDCYYTLDSLNNIVVNAEYQDHTMKDFYDFAVLLGKLYAGYSFDYFMNEYVRKEMRKKGKEYPDEIHMRYDPYESYIYYTRRDKFIKL